MQVFASTHGISYCLLKQTDFSGVVFVSEIWKSLSESHELCLQAKVFSLFLSLPHSHFLQIAFCSVYSVRCMNIKYFRSRAIDQ